MILASHGIVASQIASFDADAVAFFGRVTTAGGSLSATEKAAVNQLVLDLKANSLWSPMKAIYPMVGASAAACAQNLKSSSFTGTFTSGWTFASTGVTGNGTSAYMNTALNPSVSLSNFSAHHSLYTRTLLADLNGQGIFQTPGPNRMDILPFGGILYSAIGGAGQATATSILSFILGSRTSSTSNKMYTRGTLRNTDTSTLSTTLPNLNYYLGAATTNSAAQFYNNKEIAFASIGDGLTDTQASNFYTAVQAFQTTLSRQV